MIFSIYLSNDEIAPLFFLVLFRKNKLVEKIIIGYAMRRSSLPLSFPFLTIKSNLLLPSWRSDDSSKLLFEIFFFFYFFTLIEESNELVFTKRTKKNEGQFCYLKNILKKIMDIIFIEKKKLN